MKTIYRVTKGCCGCGTCVFECPAEAISLTVKDGATIDRERCTACGACYENCASEAIERIEAKEEE
jgi:ferredoxin